MWLRLFLLLVLAQVLWAHFDKRQSSGSSSREMRSGSRESGRRRGGSGEESKSKSEESARFESSNSKSHERKRSHGGERRDGGSSESKSRERNREFESGSKSHERKKSHGGERRDGGSSESRERKRGESESGSKSHERKKSHGERRHGDSSESSSHERKRSHGERSGSESGSKERHIGAFRRHGMSHHRYPEHHRRIFGRYDWGHRAWAMHGHGRKRGGHSSSSSGSRSSERRHHGKHHGGKHGKHGKHGEHGKHCKHEGRRHQECPAWQPWQQSKCLWPSMDYSSIPEACRAQPKHHFHVPDFLKEYKAAKAKEIYEVIQTLFKNRGATKACGYCSRKIQCRIREESKRPHFGCRPKEFEMVDEDCEGHDACQLSVVLGGCPAPTPQRHMQMLQHHKMGHHFGQFGQYHHMMEHWGLGFRHHGMDEHSRWPRSAEAKSDEHDSHSNKSSSGEIDKSSSSSEEVDHKSSSRESSEESGERWGHHRNHTTIPLWHCIKNKDGSKCLCCCGDYFPEVSSGLCKKVKFGSKLPVWDLWSLTSGGMPQGGK